MIDNPTARAAVGNIYEFVLIASERVREINKERSDSEVFLGGIDVVKTLEIPHLMATREIIEGKVGREYLKKVSRRIRQNTNSIR